MKSTTVYQNEKGREARRAGHPPRLPIAGRGTGRQGPRLWAACRPARGLPWPCRPGQRPALPPAGGVPRAPPRSNAREGGACAASARGGLNCGPPQGQGLQQQPAAGAPARLGGGTPSEGPRAATPGGECVGRAERHGLRRRRGRAGKAGRSAADRAGGADGPKAPTSGGRAAPEHLRRNRRGGGAMQGGPLARPAGAWPCIAEGCPRATAGGQLDQDAPTGAALAATFPRPDPAGGWTGRAAAQPPHRVGRVSARRPEGRVGRGPPAGGTRTGAPFPRPLDRQREQKRECPPGTPFYFWLDKGRPASRPDRWRLAPAPAWQSSFCLKLPAIAGRQYRGLAPVPRCIPSVRAEGLKALFP